MNYYAVNEKCTLCGMCVTVCPEDAVMIGRGTAVINQLSCTNCGECYENCPENAITVFESTDGE